MTSINLPLEGLATTNKTKAEKRIRIVIDPGHGGDNTGARGLYGLVEKHLSLSIAKFLKKELIKSKSDLEIFLTRETDIHLELRDRVKLANAFGGDIFLSIHVNASPFSDISGFEVYFLSSEASDAEAVKLSLIENAGEESPIPDEVVSILSDVRTNFVIERSSLLAEKMYSSLQDFTSPNKRGIRQAPFSVLQGTEMPSVLLEVGYLTNPKEALKLKNKFYLKGLVNAISMGIIEYIEHIK